MLNPTAGARKLAEFLRRLRRRCSACAFDKATSLRCLLSKFYEKATSLRCSLAKFYARHQVTERALRFVAGQAWPACLGSLLVHVVYFLVVSWFGYVLLADLKARVVKKPRGIDLFFTAVSAATGSSMSTVEMEVFSNAQLMILTVLMFIGGEVFISLVGLASRWSKLRKLATNKPQHVESHDEAELETMPPVADVEYGSTPITDDMNSPMDPKQLRYNAVRSLFFIVLTILVAVHVLGTVAVAAYVQYASPRSSRTLQGKALNLWSFAVFTTVSTFSGCGYLPTNENMAVFKRDTGLQTLLVPQTLMGNVLFPPLLAACVRAAAAWTRRVELTEMARKGSMELTGYYHLFPARRCWMLAATVAGFIALQAALVCGMEWGGALHGMSRWEKASNALFLAVNSRHTGESTIDISTLAPAILILFVVMMYLPVYTTWFPFEQGSSAKVRTADESHGTRLLVNSAVLSQLSYLAIFVIAICVTERKKLRDDPLNFSVLSVVVEVISAYGNVGFSMGYHCSRQINSEQVCTDRWTGFAGRWSDSGKLILILVMFFGRMKKFSMKGGKAWKLS